MSADQLPKKYANLRVENLASEYGSEAEDPSPPQKRARRQKSLGIPLAGLSETVSPSRTASRQLAALKSAASHPYHLPQFVDFSQWPNVLEWLQLLGWDKPDEPLFNHWESGEYRKAWEVITLTTKSFVIDRLLPHVDAVLRNTNGEWIMVAFTGLQVVLTMISKEISSRFLETASQVDAPEISSGDHGNVMDALVELDDFKSFFTSPANLNTTSAEFSGLACGIKSINFDAFTGSSLNFDDVSNTLEPEDANFGSGCKITKRRRVSEVEMGDHPVIIQTMELCDSNLEPHITNIHKRSGRSLSGSSLPAPVDLRELEELTPEDFPKHLSDFTQKNILRYLSDWVQQYFYRFLTVDSPAVEALVRLYETAMDAMGTHPSVSWESEVREDFTVAFSALQRVMFELGLVDGIVAPALQMLCQNHMQESFGGIMDENGSSRHFGKPSFAALGGLLQMVADHDSVDGVSYGEMQATLLAWAKKNYIQHVVDNFFELLLQWPKSRKTFVELKQLIDETSQNVIHSIIISLQSQFHNRLLRPGLNTLDILAVYTAAIRALRIIDPSRVIQDLVCEPVRKCLRARPDTVRCIMSHITHISSARDAAGRRSSIRALDVMIEEEEEAMLQNALTLKTSTSDIDMENWKTWQPDPIYAELLTTRTDRQADTIELLMSIYGGQDVFINEYQLILAEKLLGYYTFDADEEARHLRMMTTRFGETLLQKSEVMSRDALDSQKFHDLILEKLSLNSSRSSPLPLEVPVKTLVISHNYWPEIRTEKIKVPDLLSDAMSNYTSYFEEITETRTLEVRPELGYVKFDLELDDGRRMHVKCNPVYAAIILPFTEQLKWSTEDLAVKVGISPIVLKRKIAYWKRRNVLEEIEPETYVIVATGSFLTEDDQRRMEDEEIESAVRYVAETSSDDQGLHLQMQHFWNKHIHAMLTSSQGNGIALDRLFTTMKMVLSVGKAKRDLTVETFKQFMDTKIRSREVMYSNGRYTLVKKDVKEPA